MQLITVARLYEDNPVSAATHKVMNPHSALTNDNPVPQGIHTVWLTEIS